MKALEKAAKDREETEVERAPATAAAAGATGDAGTAGSELTLEPLNSPAATPPRASPLPREPGLAPRTAARAAADATIGSDTAQAAVLLRASRRDAGGGVGAYVREHPLIVFGALASLFLLAYGTYVYLQMTKPGLFIQQPRPVQSAQIAPPPAAPPAVSDGSAATAQQPLSTTLLLPSQPAPSDRATLPPPVPAATAGATTTASTSAPGGVGPTPAAASATAATPAAPTPAAPAPPPPRDAIRITRGGAAPTLSPLLAEAYQALDTGNLESSQRLYTQLLRTEPNNIDALLGSAAIAAQRGDSDSAARNYLKVLEFDPRNTLAQAGLIGILGRADPLAAETRVKQLIGRDPSAYLYFTLGNVYVDQNRWPDAQQAYFQAHHLQPDNPDYAYNLAVGLEHIGQPKLAVNFYRRATQLAAAKGRANFSTDAALERISQLERFVE